MDISETRYLHTNFHTFIIRSSHFIGEIIDVAACTRYSVEVALAVTETDAAKAVGGVGVEPEVVNTGGSVPVDVIIKGAITMESLMTMRKMAKLGLRHRSAALDGSKIVLFFDINALRS